MKDLSDFRQYFVDKYYNPEWINPAAELFATNNPFPHIVIDNFLPEETLNEVLNQFDNYKKEDWFKFDGQYELKLASKKEIYIPQFIRHVLHELNSGYVLDWLSALTGVPRLVADTRLYGGGMHNIERGGKLGVHIDFNIENRTMLHRQLNLLLYLNKDWQDEWGGHLELWNADKTQCVQKIAPIFNRCVIFNTNGKPWHGHPHPLNTPDGITRKSLALYYYNVGEEQGFYNSLESHTTLFDVNELSEKN
jgi:hypothetical protein